MIACSSGNCYAHIYFTRKLLSWDMRGLCCYAIVCKKSLKKLYCIFHLLLCWFIQRGLMELIRNHWHIGIWIFKYGLVCQLLVLLEVLVSSVWWRDKDSGDRGDMSHVPLDLKGQEITPKLSQRWIYFISLSFQPNTYLSFLYLSCDTKWFGWCACCCYIVMVPNIPSWFRWKS